MTAVHKTHEVTNQPPPLENFNALDTDPALVEALRREGGGWAEDRVRALGARVGSAEVQHWGHLANTYTPELRAFDRFGHRIDEVEFHPAWHDLMRLCVESGLHSLSWAEKRAGAQVARAAMSYLMSQAEAGVGCPITMTHAAVPALRAQPDIAAVWLPRILSTEYDPRAIPAEHKRGVLIGMAMTEKQGGSDVRANTTRARPLGAGGPGGEYELTGHKWFCSAPMCDAFLTLAYTDTGLSCFLVPRWLPDGTRNRFAIQRLKNKLGNRSNASSEIEYHDTYARMVGEEGRGVATIIVMVMYTRIDCALGAAGTMRMATRLAAHHVSHRAAFGKRLIEQPLMRNVVADLALESEAATVLAMRLARAFEQAPNDEQVQLFARIATPVIKYWVCKRAPNVTAEALECHGGNGFVEESMMPRLYREAPLNSLWEGSGNVQCLDVLRAMRRTPEAWPAFVAELRAARGADRRLDAYVDALDDDLRDVDQAELRARQLVERMALALQGSLLVQHAPNPVADGFCASRLDGNWGCEYGTLPAGLDLAPILARAGADAATTS